MPPKDGNRTLMSAHKHQLIVSPLAELDFQDLLTFTQKTWGKKQRLKYKSKIDTALRMITENPNIGRKKPVYRVYGVEKHQVFYRVDNTTIYVLRILHERMDAERHLLQ